MFPNRTLRMMWLCLVLYCSVNLSMGHEFCDEKIPSKPPKQICGSNCVPAYILYIVGILSALLLFVTAVLIYVLVKTQFLQSLNLCNKNKYTPTSEVLENGNTQAQTQTIQINKPGVITLENTSELQNQNENNQTLRRHDSQVTITSDFNTLRTPKKLDATGNISPRIVKGVGKDLPIILPEQMSLICKEVLKRTAKHDSSSSLHNIDQLVKEGKTNEETITKCASTPALDLCETLSTHKPDEKNTTEKKEDTNIKSTTTSRSNPDDEDLGSDCDIYDSPRAQDCIYDLPKEKNTKVENQTGYITPYFSANVSPLQDEFKTKEDKPDYAQVKDLSSGEGASKEKCETVEKRYDEVLKNITADDVYEFPKKSDDTNKMYINANDVHAQNEKQ